MCHNIQPSKTQEIFSTQKIEVQALLSLHCWPNPTDQQLACFDIEAKVWLDQLFFVIVSYD